MIQSRRRFMKYLAKLFDVGVLITAFVAPAWFCRMA